MSSSSNKQSVYIPFFIDSRPAHNGGQAVVLNPGFFDNETDAVRCLLKTIIREKRTSLEEEGLRRELVHGTFSIDSDSVRARIINMLSIHYDEIWTTNNDTSMVRYQPHAAFHVLCKCIHTKADLHAFCCGWSDSYCEKSWTFTINKFTRRDDSCDKSCTK